MKTPTERHFTWLRFVLHFAVFLPILYIILVAFVSDVNWSEILMFLFAGIATVSLEIIVGSTLSAAETLEEIQKDREILCSQPVDAGHAGAASRLNDHFKVHAFRLGLMCGATLLGTLLFLNLVMLEVKRMTAASQMVPAVDLDKLIQESLTEYRKSTCSDKCALPQNTGTPTLAPQAKELARAPADIHKVAEPTENLPDKNVPAVMSACDECPEEIASRSMQEKITEAFHTHHKNTVTSKLVCLSGISAMVILAIAIWSLSLITFSPREELGSENN